MKKIILLLPLIFFQCHVPTVKEVYNSSGNNVFQGVKLNINYGEEDHFLKIIGNDSLFVHTSLDSINWNFSHIYFTKGKNIKSISWDTGGKYSKRVTVNQN